MIIGSGQLAKVFEGSDNDHVVIFASGVANSNCIAENEFKREEKLLVETLLKYKGKKFVYFSSCALTAIDYQKNKYYQHKSNMEKLIKDHTDNYYIFRIPQLFGCLKKHKTLINFIYYSIINKEEFNLYSKAYRYVIEINDVYLLVGKYLELSDSGITVDLANPYRYSVMEIVKIFEELTDIKARCNIVEKEDEYLLDLTSLMSFVKQNDLDIVFGTGYLIENLKFRVCN